MLRISDSNPKLHETIRAMGEEEKTKLCYFMGMKRFFPHELTQLCPSGDGATKIKELVDFETDIIFLAKFIKDLSVELNNKEHICWGRHHTLAAWNVRMLDYFHQQLKSICEDSGSPSTLEKSRKLDDAYSKMTQHLIDTQIYDANVLNEVLFEVKECNIILEFNAGKFFYLQTNVKDYAVPLVDEVLRIENDHQVDKKSAIENETTLDPSVSKDYIVRQIQELEKLPVDALQAEVEELTNQICPVAENLRILMEARKYISDTFDAQNQAKQPRTNGLDKTLDLLIQKAHSFKNEWEEKYANTIPTFDGSKHKRQRIS